MNILNPPPNHDIHIQQITVPNIEFKRILYFFVSFLLPRPKAIYNNNVPYICLSCKEACPSIIERFLAKQLLRTSKVIMPSDSVASKFRSPGCQTARFQTPSFKYRHSRFIQKTGEIFSCNENHFPSAGSRLKKLYAGDEHMHATR